MSSNKELLEAVKDMGKNLTTFIEMQALVAELQRERFVQLVKRGFSEQQAIEIVSKMSMVNL